MNILNWIADKQAMKHILLIALSLNLTACVHHFKEDPEEKAARLERARIHNELVAKEYEARMAEEARQAAAIAATEKFGTPQATFDEAHGQPTQTEIHEGKTVYWYRDTDPPVYFVFKNGKLESKVIDKETMRAKEELDLKRADLRQREQANREQQKTNRMMIWQSMQNNRKRTNCTTRYVGNTAYTDCN